MTSDNYYPVTQNMDGNPDSKYKNILDHPATCKPHKTLFLTQNDRKNSNGYKNLNHIKLII